MKTKIDIEIIDNNVSCLFYENDYALKGISYNSFTRDEQHKIIWAIESLIVKLKESKK